jgi:Ca2+-binding EF-hand superfamily protein
MAEHEADPILACFSYYDDDGDARLDPTQFKLALQSLGTTPSQKDIDDQIAATGTNITYPAFKVSYDKLKADILKKETFIAKFQPLFGPESVEGAKKIPHELLQYICQECQPKPNPADPDKPVDTLSADEIEYVLSLVEGDDKGYMDVLKFASALMDTRG